MDKLVKYHNDFNNLALKNFNAQELDLLMTLFLIVKDKNNKKIILNFDQLKNLSKYKPTSNTRFINDLERTNNKLLNLKFKYYNEKEKVLSQFVLFTVFDIFLEDEKVEISINERFKWVLNQIANHFTMFELDEFIKLDSKYSKSMYKIIKQWRLIGTTHQIEIEKFRELLDIPKSYKMTHISQKVLTPIQEELSKIFKNFEIEKITKGRGARVIALKFNFEKEKRELKREVPEWKQEKKNPKDNYIRNTEKYNNKDTFDM